MSRKVANEFPQENLKGASVASPWNENLFKVQHNSIPLEKEQAELFHMVTAQGLFLCKCGHPNIAPAIAYLRVQNQIMQMPTAAISQASCEGQANPKSRWLRVP